MRENFLAEAFKDMDALNEDVFTLDDKGAEALQDFLDGDKGVDFISVIDTEAKTEEDIQDSYLGKVILDCCVCHSKCYKDKEEVILDENEEFANVGEECAYCHNKDGFKIVGEVTEFDSNETNDEEEEDEDEEVEIEKDSEEKFDDDVTSFDFEDEEEEKVEESINEAVSKTDDIDAEADDKKELAKKELNKKIDDADADRDYRLKKGITRRNESKIYKKIKEAKKCEENECSDGECVDKKIDEAPNYELHPSYDSRQSFYGKARVDTGDKGDKNKLYSYDTLVAEMIDGKPVVYGTYSATTLRHIKDWLKQNGFKAENKAQILRDYGVKSEAKKAVTESGYVSDKFEEELKRILYSKDRNTLQKIADDFEYEDNNGKALSSFSSKKIADIMVDFMVNMMNKDEILEVMDAYGVHRSDFSEDALSEAKKCESKEILTLDDVDMDTKLEPDGSRSDSPLRSCDTVGDFLQELGGDMSDKDSIEVSNLDELNRYLKMYGFKPIGVKNESKKCNIREGERRKGECKLTEAKEYTAETLAKDMKDAVDWLVGEQEGCVTLKLDDKLAVCVGWSGGYGDEKRDDVIQSTEDPDYAINAGIKVWTSDDMRTDYDWINYPYYKNGDVEDTGLSLKADEDYTKAAEWLLGEYDRMSNYEISDDGEIVEETEETIEESKKVNEAFYDTTRVLEIVSPRTKARLKRVIDTQKKYGNDMEISVIVDSPYKAHLTYGEGGADYYKDGDGKWKHDIGYIKIDSALADAIISDVCKAVGMCEKMNESVEEVKVTTETDEVNVKTEDGKVTVETQKREDEEKKDEEVIEPVSDEVKSEIEASSEKEIDGEFGDEVEVDMDDFDEESFDELGESYFKSAYNNIDSYKTSCVKAEGKRMVIEGVIKFKSGKEKSTSFVLESKEITKSGKSRFIGENIQICKGKKAFALNGTINGGRFISESFNYDYRTKDIKTGKSKRISGTVKKK